MPSSRGGCTKTAAHFAVYIIIGFILTVLITLIWQLNGPNSCYLCDTGGSYLCGFTLGIPTTLAILYLNYLDGQNSTCQTTQRKLLYRLIAKYRSVGLYWDEVFLLPPAAGQAFLQELGATGIVIRGITTWVYMDAAKKDRNRGMVKKPVYDYTVSETVLQSENAALISAHLCIDHVNRVATKVDFISVQLCAARENTAIIPRKM